VEKLKAAGVKVVDFEPYEHQKGWDIVRTLYFPDAAGTQKALLKKGGEPVLPLTEYALGICRPEPITVTENWSLNVRRDDFRAE
jgi:amidase